MVGLVPLFEGEKEGGREGGRKRRREGEKERGREGEMVVVYHSCFTHKHLDVYTLYTHQLKAVLC